MMKFLIPAVITLVLLYLNNSQPEFRKMLGATN